MGNNSAANQYFSLVPAGKVLEFDRKGRAIADPARS